MGLDASIHKIPADFIRNQPWVDLKLQDEKLEEILYRRKHGQLQNWMHNRYNELGGTDPDFNCRNLRLWEHDIEKLLSDLKSGNMPDGDGFFFGESSQEKIDADIEFFTEFLKTADFVKWGYLYSAWY